MQARLRLAALALALAVSGTVSLAHAADPWGGPYVGVTLGVAGTGGRVKAAGASPRIDLKDSSAGFGLLAGYGFGAGPGWLWGVEADFSAIGAKASQSAPAYGRVTLEANWIGSLRLRGGYAWQSLHLYGTAGVAAGDIKYSVTGGQGDHGVRLGPALGLGVEMPFGDGWRGRLEGMVYGFGEQTVTMGGVRRTVDTGSGTLRLGVARRF